MNCQRCIFALSSFLFLLIAQSFNASGQLMPSCPGRWVPSGGGGYDCRCADGSAAQAYESRGRLRFRCRSNVRRRQPDNRVHCGGGRYCPAGNQCSRSGGCRPAGTVDCGSYYCQPGNKCARGRRACITQDKVDCGPKINGTCNAGTSCFTAPTELKGLTKGKTYCLKPEQLAQVRDQLKATAKNLRDRLEAKRAKRKHRRSAKRKLSASRKKNVAKWTKNARQRNRQVEKHKRNSERQKQKERERIAWRQKRRNMLRKATQPSSKTNINHRNKLVAAQRELYDLQEQKDKARLRHLKNTEQRRQAYLKSNKQLLRLASKWNKARSAGKIGQATKLHAQLAKAKKKSDQNYKQYKSMRSTDYAPGDGSRLQYKIAKAERRVAAIEKQVRRRPAAPLNRLPPATRDAGQLTKQEASTSQPYQPSGQMPKSGKQLSATKRDAGVPRRKPILAKQNNHHKSTARSTPLTKQIRKPRLTPTQRAMRDDLLKQYGRDVKSRDAIRAVAQNADYASLSAAAYKPTERQVPGWIRLKPEKDFRYQSKIFGSNIASVYQSKKTGEIVVAFQGTDEARDNVGNLTSATRFSNTGQSKWAKKVARKSVKDYGPNVTFVGHSLGGRLARIARTETGRKAVVFDSAPLLGVERRREASLPKNAQKLLGFRSPGDPVSLLSARRDIEVKNFVPYDRKSFLTRTGFEHWYGTIGHDHSISELSLSMQTVKNIDSWSR